MTWKGVTFVTVCKCKHLSQRSVKLFNFLSLILLLFLMAINAIK